MRTLSAIAVTGGLVVSLFVASPAQAVEPAPTNIKLSWSTKAERIVVSWDEAAPVANVISLRQRGSTRVYRTWSTTVEQPNSIELWTGSVSSSYSGMSDDLPLELAVSAGSDGPEALSPRFDADTPTAPQRVSSTLAASGAMNVKWRSSVRTDTTPNDPLDLSRPLTYQAGYDAGRFSKIKIGGRTTATQLTYTLRSAHTLWVDAHNEWGSSSAYDFLSTYPTSVTAKVPAWAVYNRPSTITGTYAPAYDQRQIVLQARNTSTSAWYTVSSGKFSAGKFSFPFGTGGSRQCRVVAPATWSGNRLVYQGVSATAASTTQLDVFGFFVSPQIGTYDRNTAGVYVYPQANTTATLQRWNGKAWTTVGPVAVKKGTGKGYIIAPKAGRTAYRYYVPATLYGGTRFAAAYTNTFVNNVIPGMSTPCLPSQGCHYSTGPR
ncbi:hypothetical protein [Kribbella italica]|uniref:Fibronectin type-III domain-containing protein n=1 Tax=Kribbella italica TaxID=1540520 RepID=A0A7W9MWQ4_9ACTN|nr:hypothetical protein [Kribbella italica]MBB5838545.1 hypothetical protein [Kribbella italica]